MNLCTTPKKTSYKRVHLLPGIIICLVVFLTSISNNAMSQQLTNGAKQVHKSAQIQQKSVQTPTVQSATNAADAHLPYFNYKGITNLDDAKQAWIKDNPEAYKAILTSKKAISQPAVSKRPVVK